MPSQSLFRTAVDHLQRLHDLAPTATPESRGSGPFALLVAFFLSKQLDHADARLRLGVHRDTALVARSMIDGLCQLRWAAIRALEAAIRRRHPAPGLIFHSDRGSEYCALALRDRLVARGYRQRPTRRGPEDNAHIESFFHSLKAELIHGMRFDTSDALRRAIAQYVRYYNFQRVHSALDYRTPVDYEAAVA